jgi:hypothetical protein
MDTVPNVAPTPVKVEPTPSATPYPSYVISSQHPQATYYPPQLGPGYYSQSTPQSRTYPQSTTFPQSTNNVFPATPPPNFQYTTDSQATTSPQNPNAGFPFAPPPGYRHPDLS